MKQYMQLLKHILFIVIVSICAHTFAGSENQSTKKVPHATLFIVIHGTWGHESQWYLPEGDFFKTLEKKLAEQGIKTLSFTWSGRNSHLSRMLAGKQLKRLIETYHPKTDIYLISHSHGGNVSALATQFLAEDPENKHHIKAMLNLGTPIDTARYIPNYSVVDYVINLFSFNDLVQTVWGHCNREYPEHKNTANLRTRIYGKEPNHSQLHSPIIAQWIPTIIDQLTEHNPEQQPVYKMDMIIDITSDKKPTYEQDHWRKIDIKLDEGIKLYRGTGTNSTWETFFRVLFNYTPGASLEPPKQTTNTSFYIKRTIRRLVKLLKITRDTLLYPLYD